MMNFLDTSVILTEKALQKFDNIYISPIVLEELEKIKTSDRNEHIKYLARQAVREILNSNKIHYVIPKERTIQKILRKYKFLSDINDHKLLCAAIYLAQNTNREVNFITADGALALFGRQIAGINTIFYDTSNDEENKEDYCGWGKYYPNEEQMALLYSNPELNVLKAQINEFCEIFEGNKIKDILWWNGEKFTPIKYKNMKNPYTNEVLLPRNLEQKMAFSLLQNQNIKVKLLTSSWGSGKTLLALTYALEQIGHGNYKKLIFVRNNITVADTKDIGFLPGSMRDKMAIWGNVIADHLGGQEVLEQLMDEDVIEIYPLSHIRGRSICNSIVLCDECENMNDKLVTLLMSRIEESSEIIFCGDIKQVDDKRFESNNGITAMINNLSGEPLFGMVKLIKSERGPVAKLCDLIIPPN